MKPVYVELLALEELSKKGFRESSTSAELILGNPRYPTCRVPANIVPLLGQKLEVIDFRVANWGAEVTLYIRGFDGLRSPVPLAIMKEPLNKIKGLEVKQTIVGKKVAQFNGFCFKFPCDIETLPKAEAVKLAKWVLEMAK